MILNQCPHCQVKHVQSVSRFTEYLSAAEKTTQWSLFRCQNPSCDGLVLLVTTPKGTIVDIYPFAS